MMSGIRRQKGWTKVEIGDRSSIAWRACYWILIAILAGSLLRQVFESPGMGSFRPAQFADMIHGRADKPYVYRTLLPSLIRITASCFSRQQHDAFGKELFEISLLREFVVTRGWKKEELPEYAIAATLLYLCLIGFVLAYRDLFKTLFSAPRLFLDAVAVIALLGLFPFYFFAFGLLYDPATLFLFTFSLALMARKKWTYFLLVFFLACWNKETTILLTLIFAIHHFEGIKRKPFFRRLLFAQALIYLTVKSILFFLFKDNPGNFVLHHSALNAHYVQINIFPVLLGILCVIVPVGLWTFYAWSEKPPFLRHAIWIVVPLLVLQFFFGYLEEWRVYFEAYPILILLMCHTLARVLEPIVGHHELSFSKREKT